MREIIKNKKLMIFIGVFLVMGLGVFSNIIKKSASTDLRKSEYEYNQVNEGDSSIDGTDYVTFDAFFLRDTDSNGEAESYRGSKIEVGKSDKLYLELKVLGEVTLKNASLTFVSDNVKVGGTLVKSATIPSTIYSDNYNTLRLNDVSNGTTSFMFLNVTPQMVTDISKYSATNKVILRGTVVDNITHEEVQIEKEVEYDIDSYATQIDSSIVKTIDSHEEYTAHVTYEVTVQESNNQMPLISSFISGSVSDLKGNHPTQVTVRSADGTNTSFNYNPETQQFSATKSGVVDRTTLTKQAYTSSSGKYRYTKWYIDVTYPYDDTVYGETVSVSVNAGYVGFSDKNYVTKLSNITSKVISHQITLLQDVEDGFLDNSVMHVGSYINSINNYFVSNSSIIEAYKGNLNATATYLERWNIDAKLDGQKGHALFTESNEYLASTNFVQYTTYKSVSVSSVTSYPKSGNIKILNADTDEVILVLNKDNWGQTNEFPPDVHRVKVETADGDARQPYVFTLNFVKEFELEKIVHDINPIVVNTAGNLRNGFSGRQVYTDGQQGPAMPHSGSAVFSGPYAEVSISTDKKSYEREVSDTSIPMRVTVAPNSVDMANSVWNEGYFLVKLPNEFLDIENLTASSSFDSVSVEKVKIDDTNFIKILITNSKTWNSNIILNFNAIIDPKTSTVSTGMTVYAISEGQTLYRNTTRDIYDVDDDNNTSEIATMGSCSFSLVSPNDLITGTIAKNYDDKGSETVSPLIADVNPLRGTSDATIEVFLLNNSQNRIKDITVVGKTAYIGNKYQIGTGSLGSQFDVQMVGPINIPEELQEYVHIYYSDVEEATNDLSDANNNWSDNVSDYTTVKSYLIKFDEDYIMNLKDEYTFTYPIKTPVTTENLDKITYFTHGAYFKYIVENSTYASEVSGAKLGIRLARKYDLKLNLYKAFTDTKVAGGRYVITDSDGNEKIVSINSEGEGYVKDIYVDREYTIKQISALQGYEIDKTVRTFKIDNIENDELELSHSNNFRRISYDNTLLTIDLEDEVLYTVDLHNIDTETELPLAKSIFKITTKDNPDGYNIMTDSNGHAYLYNMKLGTDYTVTQIRVNEYAPVQYFIVRLDRDPENHDIDISVRRLPQIELTEDCHEKFSLELESGTKNMKNLKTANESYEDRNLTCKINIDLDRFSDEYKLVGSMGLYDNKSSSYNVNAYLYDKLATSGTLPTASASVNRGTGGSSFTSTSSNIQVTTAYTPSGQRTYNQIPLKGGRDYTLDIRYARSNNYSGTNYARMFINKLRLVNTNGASVVELIRVDEKENVHPYYGDGKENTTSTYNLYLNEDVKETVSHYSLEDTEFPLLEVEVRNKKIDMFKLEITKIDGDTNELLPGAQFRIEGPGLPETGKVLTVNEEGKLEIDLQLSYEGSTSYVPGLANANYPITNTYKIQEVSAPSGYSIDNKPILFQAVANIQTDSARKYFFKYLKNEDGAKNKFASTDIDTDNLIFKATMKNYPSVKIVKKDLETGDLLPNTYYIINEILIVNGIETKNPARDANGDYVGEKLNINGYNYYVIKTDENGQISLNLSSGKYELREIQAADEKYEISDQVIYFGVGETIPYQPKGISYVGGTLVDNNLKSGLDYYPTVIRTSDGGYLFTTNRPTDSNNRTARPQVVKYDKNFNKLWSRTIEFYRLNRTLYTYFDDPDRVEISSSSTSSYSSYNYSYNKPVEGPDGYYVAAGGPMFMKLDKETGEIIYNSNSTYDNDYIYHYNYLCKKEEGIDYSSYSSALLPINDDEHYYCASSNYNINSFASFTIPSLFDVNKNTGKTASVIEVNSTYTYNTTVKDDDGNNVTIPVGTNYCLKLKTGEIKCNSHNISDVAIVRYDDDGEVESATFLLDQMVAKLQEYATNYDVGIADPSLIKIIGFSNYNGTSKILDDGTVIYLTQMEIKYTSTSENYGYTYSFFVKISPNDEVEAVIPIGFNGQYLNLYTYDDKPSAIINDDGSFYMRYDGKYAESLNYTKSLFDTEYQHYYVPKDPVKESNGSLWLGAIMEYDSNGKIKNVIEYQRHTRYQALYDTSNDYHRINSNYYGSKILKVDDGFIVVARFHNSESFSAVDYDTVILANGEEVKLDLGNQSSAYDESGTSIIIYKINNDESIDWIRQYKDIYNGASEFVALTSLDDEITFVFNTMEGKTKIKDALTGETYNLKVPTDASRKGFATFKYSNEVQPEAPEAFELELFNKRKEFKINVDSNEGGYFEVYDSNDEQLYEGTKPGTIELVKYGDDTQNRLIIHTNEGYSVTSVTINDKPATFTVHEDGTVTIPTIRDVKEDKNIYVTFTLGQSQVVVHHYLNGTTVQVASDEVLTGDINTDYTTSPINSTLYSLIKDDNGEYIIPENYKGKFTTQNQVVTYYYDLNKVLLKVNHYILDTQESLIPSVIQSLLYGSDYETHPEDIPLYEYVDVEGNPSGKLLEDETVVTYYYRLLDPNKPAKLIVNYVDSETGASIADSIEEDKTIGDPYETHPLSKIPEGYVFDRVSNEESGTIQKTRVVVTYYYSKIKPVIKTKYLDKETGEPVADEHIQNVVYGQRYETQPLTTIPQGYEFDSVSGPASGLAKQANIEVVYYYKAIPITNYVNIKVKYVDIETEKEIDSAITIRAAQNSQYDTSNFKKKIKGYKFDSVKGDYKGTALEDTEVIYYYKKVKEVKPATEVPDTGDNIVTFMTTFILSIVLMIVVIFVRKKQNVK